ncbi:MAG: 2Fe-2S iron-sulfur cluster-binding protein [Gammaproteobacteria bacterium]
MKNSQRAINRYLSLSQAARLVGIKRRTLQKRIQDGEVQAFEGMVSLEELLKAYPQTEIEDNTMIEHSARIMQAAYNKLLHESSSVPDTEALSMRVAALSQELNETHSVAKKYVDIVNNLKTRLATLQADEKQLAELKAWFAEVADAPRTDMQASAKFFANDALLRLMTAHVRILPSGHDFFVEGTSSLLEAGLRSGHALNYACSNGNCGKCKARLISGNIRQLQQHDYVLSEEQKATGHFLMCCNAAVSDVVVEAVEADSARDIPEQRITAKVKKIEIKNDVALLHLKTPRTSRLRFLAGQHVTLGNDKNMPRSELTISSCPCDDMNLHFQIPKIAGDAHSEYVFNKLKIGDPVHIQGPRGDFVLNENSVHSLVFIAWHTGFAAIKSLIEHAMALDDAEHIHLFWISTGPHGRYLDNLCRAWQDALDNFHYHPIDADLSSGDQEAHQRVLNTVCDQIEHPEDYDYYVAGQSALITACASMSRTHGVPLEQIIGDTIRHE